MNIVLNPTFEDRKVMMKTALPMKQKDATEILSIAILARKSNNRHLLDCFENLPTLQELEECKTDIQIQIAKVGVASTIPVESTDDL